MAERIILSETVLFEKESVYSLNRQAAYSLSSQVNGNGIVPQREPVEQKSIKVGGDVLTYTELTLNDSGAQLTRYLRRIPLFFYPPAFSQETDGRFSLEKSQLEPGTLVPIAPTTFLQKKFKTNTIIQV